MRKSLLGPTDTYLAVTPSSRSDAQTGSTGGNGNKSANGANWQWFQTIFGSAITSTVIVVFVLNLLFNHWGSAGEPEALETAVHEGAYAPGIPNDGVNVSDGYPENWQEEPGVVARTKEVDAP